MFRIYRYINWKIRLRAKMINIVNIALTNKLVNKETRLKIWWFCLKRIWKRALSENGVYEQALFTTNRVEKFESKGHDTVKIDCPSRLESLAPLCMLKNLKEIVLEDVWFDGNLRSITKNG